MSYTPPAGDQLHFAFAVDAYTPPAGDALHFSFAPDAFTASIDLVTAAALVTITATSTIIPEATLDLTTAAVGIELAAVHGVAATLHIATADALAEVVVVHGVAGVLDLATDAAALQIDAIVLRYELRGEVRDTGVLVDRRVRAYRRDTGTLIGEADTVAGRFRIHTGFEPREHYVVPIHLAVEATDYAPPCANRVLSVLAQDAA